MKKMNRTKALSVSLAAVAMLSGIEGFAGGRDSECPVVEVAIGKLKKGADISRFLVDSRAIDPEFKKMKGFISRRLFEIPETGQWMDILCWSSLEAAKAAAEKIHENAACGRYLSHLEEKPEVFVHGTVR